MKNKHVLKDFYRSLIDDRSNPDEPVYDPVHIAAMIVIVIISLALVFWLFWALMVCEGGLFVKAVPFLKVLFTKKTLQDFGYEGYPYELGIFEGWIVNITALVFLVGLLVGISMIFKKAEKRHNKS